MNQDNQKFGCRLKKLLAISGMERIELAQSVGVSMPTVNRWLNNISTPNVYQFQKIAHYFGLPYDWFLEDGGGAPDADDLAVKLGLSPETVEALLDLVSEGGNESVLKAVDHALYAALAVIDGVFEDLNRNTDRAIAGLEGKRK